MNLIIRAVDFDGTLCENKFPEIGKPNLKLIEFLIQRQKEGDIIILWTCRRDNALTEANLWCKGYGLTFDYINENVPEIIKEFGGDCRKIFANFYYDDRSDNEFKLPFITEGFTDDVIPRIEDSIGFKLGGLGMIKCKIKADRNTCSACIDTQIDAGHVEDCKVCPANTKEGYIINTYPGSFFKPDSASVLVDGDIRIVELSRVYDAVVE